MQNVLYELDGKLYVNLTNQCPCRCTFCIRLNGKGVGTADNLWLASEPSFAQVRELLIEADLERYDEVVFCGYGEPFCALDVMLDTMRYLREATDLRIRINTNGLGDLIQKKKTAVLLAGLCDTISISLNAADADSYQNACRPEFGLRSFDAMLNFASDCVGIVPKVVFTVVDVLSQDEIGKCREIARSRGVDFRIRSFIA